MKTIEFNGTVYASPLSEWFRRHSSEELTRMRESIATEGVRVAVQLYHDTTLDVPNCVLDGEGRLSIASALPGPVSVPFVDAGRLTTDEAYQIALTLNDTRRHDDPVSIRKRREERIHRVAAAKHVEGKSIRTIAAIENVSPGQIYRDLEAAKQSGVSPETPDPEGKVKGEDGKSYPASKPRPEPDLTFPDDTDSEVDGCDEPEPESPVTTNPTEPAPTATARTKAPPRPPHHDQDHPYRDLLQSIVNLVTAISKAVNESPDDSKLRQYLLHLQFMLPRAKTVNGKHLGWRCVGLRGVYRAVRLAGIKGKVLTKAALLKKLQEANEAEEKGNG